MESVGFHTTRSCPATISRFSSSAFSSRKQAEEELRYAKAKAEQDAKEAAERRKLRAACSVLYQNTADRKIADLTVREEQQVRACQALGLYPPQ